MKEYRFLGYRIKFFFSLGRIKQLSIDIPSDADDVHVSTEDNDGNKITPVVKYFPAGKSKPITIELPRCREAKKISVTNRWDRSTGTMVARTDRKIVVEIFV